ncbi:hypothetical protein V8F06_014825 [Rhypophila decipiens]
MWMVKHQETIIKWKDDIMKAQPSYFSRSRLDRTALENQTFRARTHLEYTCLQLLQVIPGHSHSPGPGPVQRDPVQTSSASRCPVDIKEIKELFSEIQIWFSKHEARLPKEGFLTAQVEHSIHRFGKILMAAPKPRDVHASFSSSSTAAPPCHADFVNLGEFHTTDPSGWLFHPDFLSNPSCPQNAAPSAEVEMTGTTHENTYDLTIRPITPPPHRFQSPSAEGMRMDRSDSDDEAELISEYVPSDNDTDDGSTAADTDEERLVD